MRRRAFLAGLAAAGAWPYAARPQERIPRVGWLALAPQHTDNPALAAFMAGLTELGWVPRKTIAIELRFPDSEEAAALAKGARELVDSKVDVIVSSALGVVAARRATDTIPIVAAVGPPLVEWGLAESFSHPGGNVTGETLFLDEMQAKRLAFLKQVKPAMTTVGLLGPRGFVLGPSLRRALDAWVKALGLVLAPIEVAGPDDYDRALSTGPGASIDALLVLDFPGLLIGAGPGAVAAAALKRGVPTAGALPIAKSGGLIGYGADYLPMHRRAAYFVDKILKGTKPGDIPIEQATKFITVVKLRSAKALGLDVPAALLAAADEVIE